MANIDNDSLVNLVGEENATFLEVQIKQPSEYAFINKYTKNLKKQISVAIAFDKVVKEEITLDEFESSLKSDIVVNANYKGFFVKGFILEPDFYELLSFFNCNILPKVDDTNNSLIFYNDQYRIFVSNFDSENKNIAILFNDDLSEDVSMALNTYFTKVSEIKEMNEGDVLKLSYDINSLSYKSDYSDYKTGVNLYEIQDVLQKTYSYNPVDYLLTLALIYRLKLLGWDKQYIDYVANNNRGFNILNSNAHVVLNGVFIAYLSELGYIDSEYSITESGRSAILLLNYIAPINSNNYGSFFASVSNIVSSQKIAKDKLVALSMGDTSLYGIRDEFFVDEKCLSDMATGMFKSDSNYSTTIINSIAKSSKAKAIGYSSNVTVSNSESLELEICQQLFNTFNDDTLNIVGGLVAIKPYNSKEVIFVNSLIYRLIKRTYSDVTAYVSGSDSSYVSFKNNDGVVVGVIKSKNFSCQKEFIGTQDISLLLNSISKTFSLKAIQGLNITENQPVIVGIGFIEKAELTADDFKKILSVPFKELRSILGTINRDNYFSGLDENEIVLKAIEQRKGDYHIFESGVKEEMGKKLKALQVIQQHYISVGNAEKETYYFDLVEGFKEKINNFRI